MATGGTFYVDTASEGGDGTTQNHTGPTAAFVSLAAAEAALQGTLSSDLIILCAGGADDAQVTIANWQTFSSAKLIIRADPSAPDGDGKNNTTNISATFHHLTSRFAVVVAEHHVEFDGIQWLPTSADAKANGIGDSGTLTGGLLTIKNCKFRQNAGSFNSDAVNINSAGLSLDCYNNYFDWGRVGGGNEFGCVAVNYNGDGTFKFWNNTISRRPGWTDGNDPVGLIIGSSPSSVTVKNNAIFGVGGDDITDNHASSTIDFNAMDQSEGTNWTDMSPGTEVTDHAAAVVNHATGDWAIADTDSPMYSTGTATGRPSATDQNGVPWTTNDCGCFAFVAAGGVSFPVELFNRRQNTLVRM